MKSPSSVTPSLVWVNFLAMKAKSYESHFAIIDRPAAAFVTNTFPDATVIRDLMTPKWWPKCEYRPSQENFHLGEVEYRIIRCDMSVIHLLRFSGRRRNVRGISGLMNSKRAGRLCNFDLRSTTVLYCCTLRLDRLWLSFFVCLV